MLESVLGFSLRNLQIIVMNKETQVFMRVFLFVSLTRNYGVFPPYVLKQKKLIQSFYGSLFRS